MMSFILRKSILELAYICNARHSCKFFCFALETDEWVCIFNPDCDIMDTGLPSFEPKLKAVKLNPVDEEVVAVVARDEKPQTHLG